MKVLTQNPIYVSRANMRNDFFSALDGSSTPDEILKFQYWMEHNHDNVKYGQLRVWDADTSNAWKIYGNAYKKDTNKVVVPTSMLGRNPITKPTSQQKSDWSDSLVKTFTKKSDSNSSPTSSEPTGKQPMNKGLKIALITGGVILVGIGIYLLSRPKSSKK